MTFFLHETPPNTCWRTHGSLARGLERERLKSSSWKRDQHANPVKEDGAPPANPGRGRREPAKLSSRSPATPEPAGPGAGETPSPLLGFPPSTTLTAPLRVAPPAPAALGLSAARAPQQVDKLGLGGSGVLSRLRRGPPARPQRGGLRPRRRRALRGSEAGSAAGGRAAPADAPPRGAAPPALGPSRPPGVALGGRADTAAASPRARGPPEPPPRARAPPPGLAGRPPPPQPGVRGPDPGSGTPTAQAPPPQPSPPPATPAPGPRRDSAERRRPGSLFLLSACRAPPEVPSRSAPPAALAADWAVSGAGPTLRHQRLERTAVHLPAPARPAPALPSGGSAGGRRAGQSGSYCCCVIGARRRPLAAAPEQRGGCRPSGGRWSPHPHRRWRAGAPAGREGASQVHRQCDTSDPRRAGNSPRVKGS